MNLHLLRMFHAVVRTGGVSQAALALHVSQPAVSRALRELEAQLGLPLLERGGGSQPSVRGVRLTGHGQALHAHAQGIFALESAAAQEMRQRVGLGKGALNVAASTTVAAYWLPGYLALFRQAHPAVECCLRVGNTQEVAQWLLDGDCDIGVVEGHVEEARLLLRPWREDAMELVAAPDHPLAAAGQRSNRKLLAQAHWLLREHGSGTRGVTEQFWQALGIAPAQCSEIASSEAIARLVAAGFGIALLPRVLVADLLQLQALATIAPRPAPAALRAVPAANAVWLRRLHVLELRNRPPSPALQAFARLLQE